MVLGNASTKNRVPPNRRPQNGAPRPRKSMPEAVAKKAKMPASMLSLSLNMPIKPVVKALIRARPANTATKVGGRAVNSEVMVEPKTPATIYSAPQKMPAT